LREERKQTTLESQQGISVHSLPLSFLLTFGPVPIFFSVFFFFFSFFYKVYICRTDEKIRIALEKWGKMRRREKEE